MFRARERGMSFWPFAVSLLAVIVLLVMYFGVASERDQAIAAKKSADTRATDAETAKSTYVGLLGVEGARQAASRHETLGLRALQATEVPLGSLAALARYIVTRSS